MEKDTAHQYDAKDSNPAEIDPDQEFREQKKD